MTSPVSSGQLPRSGQLPHPSERPQSDIVIFDGHCRFCTAQVKRLNRWDWSGALSFLSLHDEEVYRRFPDLTHERLMEEMVVIDHRSGKRRGGAAGFRYLSRRLMALWPIAAFLHIPLSLPVWSWCYRQIANRRYRWGKVDSCSDGACEVHFK